MSPLFDTTLYYCFEKKGVLMDVDNDDSVVKYINSSTYQKLRDQGVIADGMLPKMENCFHALNRNVKKVCIGAISMLDEKTNVYTTITL